MNLDFGQITPYIPFMLEGIWVTLKFVAVALVVGFILGTVLALFKISHIKTLEDLKGKKLGVQLGTIQEDGANKIKEETVDFEIKAVDSANVLIQELLSNRIDVAYMDKAVAEGFIAEQDLAGFDDTTSSSPGMAVAFPKGSELTEKVNAILKEAEENGKLQELKDKWLSEE